MALGSPLNGPSKGRYTGGGSIVLARPLPLPAMPLGCARKETGPMTAPTAGDRSPDRPSSPTSDARDRASLPPLDATLRSIAEFAHLKPDWDSYGGAPSSPVARTEAKRWVEIVADLFGPRAGDRARPYSVAPLADGGVQVEWRGMGGIVELEVGPAGELGYLFVSDEADGAQADEADDASWSEVLRVLLRALVA